jgi:YfiH family protein
MIGRVVIPEGVPSGAALFYTTTDFDGRLTRDTAAALTAIVRERFGIESTLATCTQVHGKVVVRAPRDAPWRECDSCDALFTTERGTALGIKVADCLPVTIFDVEHAVAANIHSGWRGAVQRITVETLDALERETAFDPSTAIAFLGPAIRVCCFEVGEEVAAQFDERWIDRDRGPKPHVDVAAMTEELLRSRGIARVVDTKLCTRCGERVAGLPGDLVARQPGDSATRQPHFHSHRRAPHSGRNLAVAAI